MNTLTLIHFLAFLKIGFKISYRTVQRIVRGLSDYIRIEEIHFTQIRRRILKAKPSIGDLNLDNDDVVVGDGEDKRPITLIVDGCVRSYHNKERRLYRTKMDQEEKEFIKLHIAVDAKSKKVVSFRVTKGDIHDSKK